MKRVSGGGDAPNSRVPYAFSSKTNYSTGKNRWIIDFVLYLSAIQPKATTP